MLRIIPLSGMSVYDSQQSNCIQSRDFFPRRLNGKMGTKVSEDSHGKSSNNADSSTNKCQGLATKGYGLDCLSNRR